MINYNLSKEEKIELVNIANDMIYELDTLTMEINILKEQISMISSFDKRKPEYTDLYPALSKTLSEKLERASFLKEKIEAYKEILGIKKKRRLFKNKTL
jgi:hypothetical protein